MSRITTEQFQKYFQLTENTLILSSQIAMIAKFCGHSNFDYKIPKEDHTYDTVLLDVLEDDKFPDSNSSHAFRWFKSGLSALQSNGTLIGKFPAHIVAKLADLDSQKYSVNKVHLNEDHCIVSITQTSSSNLTEVVYSDQKSLRMNVFNNLILHHYNREYYDYLESVNLSESCPRTTIDGKGETAGNQLLKRTTRRDFDHLLFVPSNGITPKAYTFEEVRDRNIGGDAFFAQSVNQRNAYIQILNNKKVISLVKEMCYNKYTSMKLEHKKYIFNERIFNFANTQSAS
jgi:hypothetical protein